MKRILVFLLLTSFIGSAQTGYIKTVVGSGTAAYTGDGGSATAAALKSPSAIALDRSGNKYIADEANHCIRKVNASGVITTIAGNGTPGFSGDGGPATGARFNNPGGVAIDRLGNIYIADQFNNRVRKINTSGTIVTFAGNGTAGYSSDSIMATAAALFNPGSIAIDSAGNVYIADAGNNRIRMVDTSGMIYTYAGTGTSGYSGDYGVATGATLYQPKGITIDNSGYLYIADNGNNCIRKIDNFNIINTIAGTGSAGFSGDGGAANSATLSGPVGVAVNARGDVFVADAGNNRIRRVDTSGFITTIAGIGTAGFSGDGAAATAAMISYPSGLAIDNSGNLFLADQANNRIRYVLLNHAPFFSAGHSATYQVCQSSTSNNMDTILSAVDSEAGQTETWLITQNPAHGTLSGFPGTATSTGDTVRPTGLSYAPGYLYAGNDTFKVRVSDGYASDTISIFVMVNALPVGGHVTGADSVCPGGHDTLVDDAATPGGIWSHTGSFIDMGTYPGTFTGITPGTEYMVYTITTSCGTASSSLRVTVNPAPISGSIVGGDSICVGTGITLINPTATPYGVWTTSDTSIATIMAVGADTGIVTGRGGGTVTIYYNAFTHCGSAPAYHDVVVSPNAGTIYGHDSFCLGTTDTLVDYVPGGTWTTGSAAIATVSSRGVVFAASVGSTVVSYTVPSSRCGTATAVFPVTVRGFPVAGTITGAHSICAGDSATLSDTITGGAWLSATTAIATINAVTGVVTGLSTGTATISYAVTNACETVYTSASVVIDSMPYPGTISGADSVCLHDSVTATGIPGGGRWSVRTGNAAIGVARVTFGNILGIATGVDTIIYTLTNTCGSSATQQPTRIITLPDIASITGASTVCAGSTVTLSDTAAGGSWTTTASGIATVAASTGMVRGLAAGAAVITYSLTNICGTSSVEHNITVTPLPVAITITGSISVCPGGADTLSASDTGGTWSAANLAATTHNLFAGRAIVNGAAPGIDTITYTLTNSCGTSDTSLVISVTAPPVAGAIVAGIGVLCPGTNSIYTDTISGGRWSSSNPAIATVNTSTGLVFGVAAGTDTLRYAVSNACSTTTITKIIAVSPSPSAGVITGPDTVCQGAAITLMDTAAGSTGTWATLHSLAAASGSAISGVSAGTDTAVYTVTNTCGTARAIHPVVVATTPAIHVITGPTQLCPGSSAILSDLTPGGTWSAGNSFATVSGGVVSGIAIGVDPIYYAVTNACGSDSARFVISVARYLVPSVSAVVSPDSNVCTGTRVTFSAVPVNGGSAPFVQWETPGGTTLGTGASFSYAPSTGDVIGCIMVSDDACAMPDTVRSNFVTMSVNDYVTPSTSISCSTGDTAVSPGTMVTFSTNLSYCGPNPGYQWFLNGNLVAGATSATYAVAVAVTDTVWCVITCDMPCATTPFNHTNTIIVSTGNTGVSHISTSGSNFSLYPDPANGTFTLYGPASSNNGSVIIDVLNMAGQPIYSITAAITNGTIKQQVALNNDIPAGQYLVRLSGSNTVEYLHFVIVR